MKALTTILLTLLVLGGCVSRIASPTIMNGYGVTPFENGGYYEGPIKDGMWQGWGKIVHENGDVHRAKFNKGFVGTRYAFDKGENGEGFGAATCTRNGQVYFSTNVTQEALEEIKNRSEKLEQLGPIDLSEIEVFDKLGVTSSPNYFVIDRKQQVCYTKASYNTTGYHGSSIGLDDLVLFPIKVALGTVVVAGEIANSPAGQAALANQEAKNQKAREQAAYNKGKRDGERRARKSIKKEPRLPQP